MKNAGMAGAVALVGVGLITIGLGNFVKAPQAMAAPVVTVVEAGPEEPAIVWYGLMDQRRDFADRNGTLGHYVYRAWSDGMLERRYLGNSSDSVCGVTTATCITGWEVIASPTEGLNAAADINFDEVVDGADMGLLLGNWGKAPRSPIPASDCPLGLMQ